jgi:hypothetical protein
MVPPPNADRGRDAHEKFATAWPATAWPTKQLATRGSDDGGGDGGGGGGSDSDGRGGGDADDGGDGGDGGSVGSDDTAAVTNFSHIATLVVSRWGRMSVPPVGIITVITAATKNFFFPPPRSGPNCKLAT